jgi:hypothetical protein
MKVSVASTARWTAAKTVSMNTPSWLEMLMTVVWRGEGTCQRDQQETSAIHDGTLAG